MNSTPWILLDTETNGIAAPVFVVEIGAQRTRGWTRDGPPFRRLLNQNTDIPPTASRVHGYTREILERDGEDPTTVYRDFAAYVEDRPLVAYNLPYDLDPQEHVSGSVGFRRMNVGSAIDTNFDFRSDTPPGKDPDAYSPTLHRYHKELWSKTLPSGIVFNLVDTTPGIHLHHRSDAGEFWLSSDAVVPTFTREAKIKHITEQIPPRELDSFSTVGYTIGGMMIFPGNRVGRKATINTARGFHPRIKDRFDLTVECIRRYYLGDWSPLGNTLERYSDFFALFQDFRGYAEFFLLQDAVEFMGARNRRILESG